MQTIAPLYGLVLAGGKSQRMGRDKGKLRYHGLPQREYTYRLLNTLCERCYLSLRSDQVDELPEGLNTLVDLDQYRGPFNGLLTAHKRHPEAAWLVVACDIPLLDEPSLQALIEARNPAITATAYATRESGLPEPLAAIWEPTSLQAAIAYLQDAQSSCPRKFLLQSEVALVYPKDDSILANANDPQEYKAIQTKLTS